MVTPTGPAHLSRQETSEPAPPEPGKNHKCNGNERQQIDISNHETHDQQTDTGKQGWKISLAFAIDKETDPDRSINRAPQND